MSCEIKRTANLANVEAICKGLRLSVDSKENDWLSLCTLSLSPTGEIIAISYETRLVVLTAKWDSKESKNIYSISWEGALDPPHQITAVICLPISAQGQSSQGGADWTCLAVGFSTGHCKFYTENVDLLLSEKFHDEPVLNLKCQTGSRGIFSTGDSPVNEELRISYNSNICIVSLNALFQTLRNNRLQLARAQAKALTNADPATASISFKKWGFTDQGYLKDTMVVGLERSNTFDHLLTASTVGGFHSRYRAQPPHNTLVLGAGARPYLGFHFALEGGTQPILSDVAKVVANKIKSALPSWLTGKNTQAESVEAPPIPAESMSCRFGLCDLPRQAESVIISPNKTLSAVTDNLGRVILVDNHRGIALRVWKGYRGAQCAFLKVREEVLSRRHRHAKTRAALFLIIYAPKKGFIEIWALQQGPKIATFSATKNGKLIYSSYGLVGFTGKTKYQILFPCIFLDPDGTLKEIVVPFHYAISDRNSKRARDVHLVKKLKEFIKSNDFNREKLTEEVVNTCKELTTIEMRSQCVEMLIGNKNIIPEALLGGLNEILEKILLSHLEESELENDLLVLQQTCYNLRCLTEFYMYANEINHKTFDLDEANGNVDKKEEEQKDDKEDEERASNHESENNENVKPNNQEVDTQLRISEREMNNLQRLLDLATMKDNKSFHFKVKFTDEVKSPFSEYLSAFNTNKDYVCLKKTNPDILFSISNAIFNSFIVKSRKIDKWIDEAKNSQIPAQDFVRLLLAYWLNRPFDSILYLEEEMCRFSNILYLICQLMGTEEIFVLYNEISAWWQNVRDILAESPCPFRGLMAAILCKIVAQKIEREHELDQSIVSSEEDPNDMWETVSKDILQWVFLIGKMDDVSLLNVILSNNPVNQTPELPEIEYNPEDISLKLVLEKGKGVVSELVARWLGAAGVGPNQIINNELQNMKNIQASDTESANTSRPTSMNLDLSDNDKLFEMNIEPIFEQLNMLLKPFPFSLQSSFLLTNMAWEYSAQWQKDVTELKFFEASVKCIEAILNPHIRQGICSLTWFTHTAVVFKRVCLMFNKAGKLPKERICRQEVGFTDQQTKTFLKTCIQFMDVFMKSLQRSYDSEKLPLKYEHIWDNGPIPLTQLALQQPASNYELLLLHYQLACALSMMAQHKIRMMKPMAQFFDIVGQQAFFNELSSKPQLPSHAPDPKVMACRTALLTKLITASVDLTQTDGQTIFALESDALIKQIKDLALLWGIDEQKLVRHQVIELFNRGFDSLAEENIASISDFEGLGSILLEIAGRRLLRGFQETPGLRLKVAVLGPALTSYLDTLERSGGVSDVETPPGRVAAAALECLAHCDTRERRVAALMVDACGYNSLGL